MRSRSFADVLDDALGLEHVAPAPTLRTDWNCTVHPGNPFLFFKLPDVSGPKVVFATAAPLKRADHTVVAPSPLDLRRSIRTLTPVQQCALDTLLAMGASLSPDFTARELRREFRLLARRIHPDRHHAVATEERARLSRQFSDLTDNYRRLLAIVEPRH